VNKITQIDILIINTINTAELQLFYSKTVVQGKM